MKGGALAMKGGALAMKGGALATKGGALATKGGALYRRRPAAEQVFEPVTWICSAAVRRFTARSSSAALSACTEEVGGQVRRRFGHLLFISLLPPGRLFRSERDGV